MLSPFCARPRIGRPSRADRESPCAGTLRVAVGTIGAMVGAASDEEDAVASVGAGADVGAAP